MPSLQVVAAVLKHNDKILIAQRKRTSKHPLKWEFPGGKVESNESPQAALARELREELNIEAGIGPQLDEYEFTYPGAPPTHLLFFEVTQWTGEPQNLDFEQMCWETPERLQTYDFLEGDVAFLRKLLTEFEFTEEG
jgi:8-oxo-dGTP diphosphatase